MFQLIICNLSNQNNMNALLPRDEKVQQKNTLKAQNGLLSWNCINRESQGDTEIFLYILDLLYFKRDTITGFSKIQAVITQDNTKNISSYELN